jgi:hypothetical protein
MLSLPFEPSVACSSVTICVTSTSPCYVVTKQDDAEELDEESTMSAGRWLNIWHIQDVRCLRRSSL